MKHVTLIALSLFFSACASPSTSSDGKIEKNAGRHCLFTFEGIDRCDFSVGDKTAKVELEMGEPEDGERALEAVNVSSPDASHQLNVSGDATIIEGDQGYVQFQDINFDGRPDIAVTTSFGAANLYLDYWVYEADNDAFRYVGNFPRLQPDTERKVLTSRVKVHAGSYERKVWVWEKGGLVSESRK